MVGVELGSGVSWLGVPGSPTYPIFGVSWAPGASNPALTRTGAAVGLTAQAGLGGGVVTNDFDNMPIWGEMESVTDDLGNVFIRIPKFYVRKTATSIEISKSQRAGFYLPKVFWDFTAGAELAHYDHGRYKASLDGAALASKPATYPLVNKNIVEFRGYAQANNAGGRLGYQQLDIHAQDVLQTLFTVEFATRHSQSVMQGFTAGQWNAAHTATVNENGVNRIIVANATAAAFAAGQTISVGTSVGAVDVFYGRTITSIDVYDVDNKAIVFDGAVVNIAIGNVVINSGWKSGFSASIAASSGSLVANNGLSPCSYRGIESPWGDLWQFVDGVNINENQGWACPNAAAYQSNFFSAPYVSLAYVNGSADGWATALGYDALNPFAQFPTAVGGGSTTYYSDYYYQAAAHRIAFVGGAWDYGSFAGLWSWALYDASSAAVVNVGGRLLKKAL